MSVGPKNIAVKSQQFVESLVDSISEDKNFKNGAKLLAVLYGGPIGLFCCLLCAGGVFVCYTGKMADTLVVPLSGFSYFLNDPKKGIISDEWWGSALDMANESLEKAGTLMISPIAIPAKLIADGSFKTLDETGMGDLTKKSAENFNKAAKKIMNDPNHNIFSPKAVGFNVTRPSNEIKPKNVTAILDNSLQKI